MKQIGLKKWSICTLFNCTYKQLQIGFKKDNDGYWFKGQETESA